MANVIDRLVSDLDATQRATLRKALAPSGPRVEAYGVSGMRSKPWRRVFASEASFERFMDSPAAGNVSIHGTRNPDQ